VLDVGLTVFGSFLIVVLLATYSMSPQVVVFPPPLYRITVGSHTAVTVHISGFGRLMVVYSRLRLQEVHIPERDALELMDLREEETDAEECDA